MAFIRKIKKGDAIYLAKVESYRQDGKVKQRVLEYVGKEEDGVPIQKVDINKIEVENKRSISISTGIEIKLLTG